MNGNMPAAYADVQRLAFAHDMRTPMTCVAGAAQTALMKSSRGGSVDEQLRQILTAVETMNRLLAQHCGETGGAQRFTGVQLEAEMRALFSARAAQKGQTLTIDCAALGLQPLAADYAALSRILGNLLGNAVKYTGQGGHIALHGGLHARCGRSEAVFVVSDDGAGMGAAFLRRAFDLYARSGDTDEEGSGLGLAIAQRLARGMGGGLRVRSAPGKGAVFTLRVPLVCRKTAVMHGGRIDTGAGV